jgi:serine/threonine protein kinase/predicted ATPase/Tfp pilus assembly protein PilF
VNDDTTISLDDLGRSWPSKTEATPRKKTIEFGSLKDLPLRFGRYELQSILGQGGMAQVFRAELRGPAGFRKPVALKIITPKKGSTASDSEMLDLIQEACLAGRLKHPNLVDVYELGRAQNQLFISMELIDGLTLHELIRNCHPIPRAVILEIAMAITAGLEKAHGRVSEERPLGLVHCDLKPSNILISWNGEVKIGDFGVSIPNKSEGDANGGPTGVVRGTVGYQSPEQIEAKPLDGRSDIFNVGLIIAEMVLGRRPFEKRYLTGCIRSKKPLRAPLLTRDQHKQMERVAKGLGAVILRCLAPNLSERYPNAHTVGQSLRGLRRSAGYEPTLNDWLSDGMERTDSSRSAPSSGFSGTGPSTAVSGSVQGTDVLTRSLNKGNIEPSLDHFVGRDSALKAVDQCFKDGARLVTIKGFGGTGKTRFSRHHAREKMAELAGGAWFVDLTDQTSALGILQATAAVLNLPLAGKNSEDELLARVGRRIAAKGPMLIVLDNFEQVVEHAPSTLGTWLKLAPEAMFLVTSREPLKLSAEQVFSLDPLPESDGVTLYKLRAHSAGAHWPERKETNATIQSIVQQLDGLPLAIELAAARARMMSHEQILQRLTERFKLLGGARRGDPDRQATLRGLIDWSWDLLEPWEQSALAQLSVFRNGFFMEAAEAVLDLSAWPQAPWALDVVGSLLDKSLLHSRQVLGQPRFDMYVSIQKYASERLDPSESASGTASRQETQHRHATWYGRMGTADGEHAIDSEGRPQRWAEVFCELENLIAGAARGTPDSAALCCLAAMGVACLKGPVSMGVNLSAQALEGPAPSRKLYLRLAVGHSRCLRHQGSVVEAAEWMQSLIQDEVPNAEETDSEFAILQADRTHEMGAQHYQLAQYEPAKKYFLEALALYTEHGDKQGQGGALIGIGGILRLHGKGEEAIGYYQQAIQLHDEVGDHRSKRFAVGQLGSVFIQQGRLDDAEKQFRTALNLHLESGDKRGEGIMLGNLGLVYQSREEPAKALEHFYGTLKIQREYGDIRGEGIVLGNLGFMLFKLDRLDEAHEKLERAIDLMLQSKLTQAAGAFRGALARVLAQNGQVEEALQQLEQGEPEVKTNPAEFIKFLCNKGCVLVQNGQQDSARATLDQARALTHKMGLSAHSEIAQAIDDLVDLLENATA